MKDTIVSPTACEASSGAGCSAVSVSVFEHPRGSLVCVDYNGQSLSLTVQEAQDLYEQLDDKLCQIPSEITKNHTTQDLSTKLKRQAVDRRSKEIGRPCTTHHHACDCRERKLRKMLQDVCGDLMMSSNALLFKSFVEINEFWIEQYGCEIMDHNGEHTELIKKPNPSHHDGAAPAPSVDGVVLRPNALQQ